jgi:Tfp pilus assembly protein PilV
MTRKIQRGSGGYSMIELMVAVALFATGLLGIMAMEIVATKGNKDSHDMTVAVNIAEWWMERLRVESLMWYNPAADITDGTRTPMLVALGAGVTAPNGTTGWVSPPLNPRYDKWLRTAAALTDPGEYCTQYRLSTVVASELIRAEVRVMWWRSHAARPGGWQTCPTGMLAGGGVRPDISKVQSVTLSSMLWRHGFAGL